MLIDMTTWGMTKLLGWILIGWLIMFAGTPALANSDNFFGTESLKPMVEGDETTIHFPGMMLGFRVD